MSIIFGIACIVFVLGIPILGVMLVIALVKPGKFNKRFKRDYTRRKIAKAGLLSILATFITSFTAMALTVPPTSSTSNVQQTQAVQQVKQQEAPKPVTKAETTTESIPFETTEQQDNTLPNGQHQTVATGINGVRTHTFEVTYLNSVEQSRKEVKNEITTQPVTQIVKVGTYVAPAPSQVPATMQGDNTNGATAKCNDDTLSYSANHRGTCSHHGGVEIWYN